MNPRRLRVLPLVAVFVLAVPVQAESERDKRYELHIVVHVARNRLLTNVFRERIERGLHDGFQAGLGDMGRVRVTHEHPRLADVLTRGLKQSLDDWRDRSGVKTHFVLIDYAGAYYEIEARQYDGTIGRASPVVRRSRTRDRDFVAKAAALLVKQDFGILGVVREAPQGQEQGTKARVELRGGALGDLSRWVQKGDIFALAPPNGGSLQELNWSLLQVEEPPAENDKDGMCSCRFFHRYRIHSILGYHCIKLGTVRAPLRLRWMQETPEGPQPLDRTIRLFVDVFRHGFQGEGVHRDTRENGLLDMSNAGADGIFTNVAFVRIVGGMAGPKPQIPIALVDDKLIVLSVNATQNSDTLFAVDKDAWQKQVAESLAVQIQLFKRLETLGGKADSRGQIIGEAERGLERSRRDLEDLTRLKKELLDKAKANGVPLDVGREEERIRKIKTGKDALTVFIAEQKKIEKEENDPQKKKWRSEAQRAQLLEKDFEIGKAIAIYKKIKGEGFQNAELDAHLKDLEKLWKPVNDEHKKAREFIYRVWPALDSAQLEENIDKARKALQTCQGAHDEFSVRKWLNGAESHADRLTKELGELHPETNPDDEAPARRLKKVSDELVKLYKEFAAEPRP